MSYINHQNTNKSFKILDYINNCNSKSKLFSFSLAVHMECFTGETEGVKPNG